MAGPLALQLVVVGHVSWADANRFGPGYLNGWAFGPKRNPARFRAKGPFVRIAWPKAQRRARFANPQHRDGPTAQPFALIPSPSIEIRMAGPLALNVVLAMIPGPTLIALAQAIGTNGPLARKAVC